MKNKKLLLFFLSVLLVPLLAFGSYRWYEDHVSDLPYFGSNYTIDTKGSQHFKVPDFSFTNQDSGVVNENFVQNKVWVVHFFFTSCPSICPRMIQGMKIIQAAYPEDPQVRMISITVDPAHDLPFRLSSYATKKGIDKRQWVLATGAKTEIYRFARKALFIDATDGDGGDGDFIHSDKLVLIDRNRHIRGYYDGTDKSDVERLIQDIRKLK